MKKILVIGSLNMDFTVKVKQAPGAGETVLADDMELVPGGKGANQAYAAAKAKALGKYVILDPAPAHKGLPPELLESCDLVKPNEHEISALLGSEEEIPVEEAAGRLQAEGIGDILVTLGTKGSCYFAKNGSPVFVPARKVKAVDSTGAGDCYTAALAEELARGRGMEAAMEFAAKAGALSVTRPGAQPSFPAREEIETCFG